MAPTLTSSTPIWTLRVHPSDLLARLETHITIESQMPVLQQWRPSRTNDFRPLPVEILVMIHGHMEASLYESNKTVWERNLRCLHGCKKKDCIDQTQRSIEFAAELERIRAERPEPEDPKLPVWSLKMKIKGPALQRQLQNEWHALWKEVIVGKILRMGRSDACKSFTQRYGARPLFICRLDTERKIHTAYLADVSQQPVALLAVTDTRGESTLLPRRRYQKQDRYIQDGQLKIVQRVLHLDYKEAAESEATMKLGKAIKTLGLKPIYDDDVRMRIEKLLASSPLWGQGPEEIAKKREERQRYLELKAREPVLRAVLSLQEGKKFEG